MEYKIIVTTKGEVIVPKGVSHSLGIEAGTEMIAKVRDDKVIELKAIINNKHDADKKLKADNDSINQSAGGFAALAGLF